MSQLFQLKSLAPLLPAVWAAGIAASAPLQADAYYVVSPMGPLPGQPGPTWAVDVNDHGTVYGVAMLDGSRKSRCFLLENGALTVFGADEGHPYAWPGSLNNATDFVGTQSVLGAFGTYYQSFVGVMPFLPDLFPQFPSGQSSHGHDINDGLAGGAPWACGTLRQDQQIGVGSFSVYRGYLAQLDGNPNPAIPIAGLGGTYVRASALNDTRDVVGASLTATGPLRAFLRSAATGSSSNLGTLGGTGTHSWATDINTAKEIVGWSGIADGGTRAFRVRDGVMRSLGTLGGHISEAHALNDAGQVVGMSFNAEHKPRAFLHDGSSMLDLNRRIAPDSGWKLQYAKAINESGAIVGWGRLQNETRGFLLTPRSTGDATLDGLVDLDDVRAVLQAWGVHPESPATGPADVAPPGGDGQVNLSDLLAVITHWSR